MQFDNNTVKPVSERDREYLADLIEADPYHKDRMTPDFFLRPMQGENAFVVENEMGYAVMYVKVSTVARVSIQFTETRDREDRERNRGLLTSGLKWLEDKLRAGYREIIFDTESPGLRLTAKKRLGFQDAPKGGLSRLIHPAGHPAGTNAAKGVWQPLPQASEEVEV
jgi:hypothetical protein